MSMRWEQKISWTRSELKKFEELNRLETEAYLMAENYVPYGVTVDSVAEKELGQIWSEVAALSDALRALMGGTRFDILMNDRFTMQAWRAEIGARYIAKHPEEAPLDCRPGWE